MPVTTIASRQYSPGSILRSDLNTATTGSAVTTKIVQGINVTISSTGVDSGTGDVTINSSTAISTASIPFTDGDTSRRVTISDIAITSSSNIVGIIVRPSTSNDSQDFGYIYNYNIVNVGTGSFDLLITATDGGLDDITEFAPNETVTFNYIHN
ncbi:MAG TPA: hypothetical protein VNZ45_12845 [Bacteroidia bacterium]|jgi:hypothetical protein|nr:hypothetical protein [Bacteroidia bacterium]